MGCGYILDMRSNCISLFIIGGYMSRALMTFILELTSIIGGFGALWLLIIRWTKK